MGDLARGRAVRLPRELLAVVEVLRPTRRERRHRYWRYVELFDADELVSNDLEMLRRIDPGGMVAVKPGDLDLERAWKVAAADIVAAHNARANLRAQEERIGPRQRWALETLRDPGVALPDGADLADEALSVERSSAVRRALGEIEEQVLAAEISKDEAASRIVGVVEQFGLRPVEPPPLPRTITENDLGVVCWMGVLPPIG